jgi:hypothetical protein
MKRKAHATHVDDRAIGHAGDWNARPKPVAQELDGRIHAKIPATSTPRVIAVSVSDNGGIDRSQGVDVKPAARAVHALRCQLKHWDILHLCDSPARRIASFGEWGGVMGFRSRAKRLFLGVLLLAAAVPAKAEDTDIIIVGWFDHFTYGLVNTAVGIPVALAGMAGNWIVNGTPPRIGIDSTGQQIVLPTAPWNSFNYSTGALHHGDAADAHEAGHGKQSGVMGPAFLPVVGLTYLIQGLDVGVMEDWADAWQNLGATMVNHQPLRVDVEVRDRDGQTSERLGLNFVVLERASRVDIGGRRSDAGDNPTEVVYKYGRVGVYILVPPGPEGASAGNHWGGPNTIFPARVEGTVMEKDFFARWNVVGGIFSVLADSQEKTLSAAVDFTDQRVQAKFLSQVLGFGVRVGDVTKVALDVMGRAGADVEGLWFLNAGAGAIAQSPGVMVTAGLGAEARLHVLQYVELYGKIMREWQLGGAYRRDTKSIGAETPMYFTEKTFTGGRTRSDKANPLPFYGGVKFTQEVETFADPVTGGRQSDIKSILFTFGGRYW